MPAPPDTTDCPLRFPGQYHDPETGLHYNHHRYYDPETARYISPDPLGLQPAPNHHAYVDNPLGDIDPHGLAPCSNVPSTKRLQSRSAAFREAKRDLGIPVSQQPDLIRIEPMTDRTGRQLIDKEGQRILTREYVFTRGDGRRFVIQDHSAGHQFGQGGIGDQGPHLNVRPYDQPRTGKVPGTAQHYEY
ncbi:RHS repeat-associated core domain-containing protein [Streptomyces sp. B1866]|uniref:HNH/endonuclease VII fold putative polymorphic toxin n=1 Tax=Streptomyces sp. B1866 TaxID=3075431 RepID=UPI0028918B85|nr:HNH/endonuclease VII fold putative polymorphic toxin [Streptomyces sp. B1866]MDT3400675.1 RHS repeat-associated core domain-containing protein [Streptomyces sp. B1866]